MNCINTNEQCSRVFAEFYGLSIMEIGESALVFFIGALLFRSVLFPSLPECSNPFIGKRLEAQVVKTMVCIMEILRVV